MSGTMSGTGVVRDGLMGGLMGVAGNAAAGRTSANGAPRRERVRLDSETDEALMARAGLGDGRACAVLVERHLPRIVGMARRMLGNAAEAEDVAQDAFLRVWRAAPTWEPKAKFSTWLYRVVVNLVTDRRRRRVHDRLDAVPEPVDPAPGAFDTLVEAERGRLVEAALAALPERQREALVLCHFEGVSNIEAAEVLDVSVEALESLLSRGRRGLRQRLSPPGQGVAAEGSGKGVVTCRRWI